MGISLIVLKSTGQQIIGDIEINEEAGIITCYDPLSISWVRPDKKLTRVLLQLTIFPPMVDALTQNLDGHNITLRTTDVISMVPESCLKPEAVSDYRKRRQEIYGKIPVIHSMPSVLKGEA